jgi:hypothetical protein
MATSPETDSQARFLAEIFKHLYQDPSRRATPFSPISTALSPTLPVTYRASVCVTCEKTISR